MQKLIIHLISDSSDQVVKYAAKAALAEFPNVKPHEYHWPMIRNDKLLDEAFNKIKKKPGIILYTIADSCLRKTLIRFALEQKIPCVSVVGKIVREVSVFLGISPERPQEYDSKFDESYFDKLKAIDYSLRHDDGQAIHELEEADIILIGPSRTSKTPISIYLAYNGFKTANVPYIYGHSIPDVLEKLKHPIVIGLVTNPSRLMEIRESRMNLLHIKEHTSYTDINIIKQEYSEVKRICQKNNWNIIDTSTKSIEESAALITRCFYENIGSH